MRRGLSNPNSIQALQELKMEIGRELGIPDIESMESNLKNEGMQNINKKLTEKYKNNLIGFK